MTDKQKHSIPALMSFILPGLGQVAKGHFIKAMIMFSITMVSWLLTWILIGYIPLVLVWLWSIYDAYNK